jgi:hypothetical protein
MGKTFLAILPVVVFALLFFRLTGSWWMEGSTLQGLLYVVIAGTVSLGIVLGMYRLMRVEILTAFKKNRGEKR